MPYVTDTHALVWYVTDDPQLSSEAKKIFRKVDSGQDQIFIPCIIFFELLYLIEKKKIAIDFDDFVATISSSRNYRIEPLCLRIIEKCRMIPRERVPDPWDRLIAATAIYLGLPLITRDGRLRKEDLNTIW